MNDNMAVASLIKNKIIHPLFLNTFYWQSSCHLHPLPYWFCENCEFNSKIKFLQSLLSKSWCIDLFEFVVLNPPFILGPTFLVAKSSYVHHEHPGYYVHNHAAELHYQRGPGRREFTVKHHRADSHAHGGEQENEKQVHDVAQQAVVQAQLAEEPAGLQQGVGDLAAEDNATGLTA